MVRAGGVTIAWRGTCWCERWSNLSRRRDNRRLCWRRPLGRRGLEWRRSLGLLLVLIRRGAVSRAATLIFLVPPTVALEAYWLFGEAMGLVQVAGMVVTAGGVALATRRG